MTLLPQRGALAPLACLALMGASLPFTHANAEPITFNPAFLHRGSAAAQALTALEAGQGLTPGRYPVRVMFNHEDAGLHDLELRLSKAGALQACLAAAWLQAQGFRREVLPQPVEDEACLDLPEQVPGATVQLDSQALTLSISLPQIAVRRDTAGRVDPARWDAGINAAFVNYQANLGRGSGRAHTGSEDLLLDAGLNLGAWQLRSSQNLRRDEKGREWERLRTYAQRDMPGLSAKLTLGETYTGGDVLSSEPLTGVVLATDMGMLPDSQQTYAPVVRGVALSRAKLEIRQNGYLIHSAYVSAGPFEIDDLAVAGSGELEVTLIEADGQVRQFTQAFSTFGNLLREGITRYELSVGQYHPARDAAVRPMMWQASVAHGIGYKTTLYGGLRGADFYHAGTLGIARDLGRWGALAGDLSQSRSETERAGPLQGQSYSIRYGKHFSSNTYLRFAGYRYSTQGYRDFGEAMAERSRGMAFHGNRRSRLDASINQTFNKQVTFNLSVAQEDYWGPRPSRRQFQFSLGSRWRQLQYSLFASQSWTQDTYAGSRTDRQVGLSASLPLGLGANTRASFDATQSMGQWSERATLAGYSADRALNYSAGLSRSSQGSTTGAFTLGQQGRYGGYSLGLTESGGYRSLSASAAGSVLAHADGFVFAPPMGDTIALVHVPGVSGAGVQNAGQAKTNADGYMVAPYLRPYRANTLELTTEQLGLEVEIDNGAVQVVPRRGAVVRADYAARQVARLILTLHDRQGAPLPFGAQAQDQTGEVLGVVGQGGQLLIATDLAPRTLTLAWAQGEDNQCQLELDPAALPERDGLRLHHAVCG
jgi:outer membrane usher protein